MQVLDNREEGVAKQKIDCISSYLHEFPSIIDSTFEGLLYVLETEEDVRVSAILFFFFFSHSYVFDNSSD